MNELRYMGSRARRRARRRLVFTAVGILAAVLLASLVVITDESLALLHVPLGLG